MTKTKIVTYALLTLLLLGLMTAVFPMLMPKATAAETWTLTTNGVGLKAYPTLQEYAWQKNASMAPNGPYDKIGLHRLVKSGITPKGVIFITNCPNWGTGEQRISNPASDNWTKFENYSEAIFWANRGYDVYAIDYRTHFIPPSFNATQVSFMADWGWDVWISDIKEAADKVKEVSGSNKFFIAGECTGGVTALNYATEYWKSDLRGIILLDPMWYILGYPMVATTGTETNTYNLNQTINAMKTAGTYATGFSSVNATKALIIYAFQNPGAPAEYPFGTPLKPTVNPVTNNTWANITEWFTYIIQNCIGTTLAAFPGAYSNLAGGYGNITQFEYSIANSELIPSRLSLENAAMSDWINCPYLAYDYNDHYKEINVPVLTFGTGLFSNRTGALRFVNGINNTDFTGIMLKNYGHIDDYYGNYAARDVFEPAYQWMVNRTLTASATAQTTSVQTGQSATFSVTVSGGPTPYTYQWYEGTTALAGQNSSQLTITKSAAGTFTYFCKVTDAMQMTTNTTATTLVVSAPPTPVPTPIPTMTPAPTAAHSPTPNPTPTQQPTATPTAPATTSTPTTQPTSTSNNNGLTLSTQAIYAIAAAVVVIIVIGTVAFVIMKRAK